MKMILNYKILTLLCSGLFLISCSKGFQNETQAVQVLTEAQQSQGTTEIGTDPGKDPVTAPDPLKNINFTGLQRQGLKADIGRVMFEIDRPSQALVIILPIPTDIMQLMGAIQLKEFQDLKDAKLITRKMSDGSQRLAVSVPLKYLVHKGHFKDKQSTNLLPNGQVLPKFPDGEGAVVSMTIANSSAIHLYLGINAAAVFIETPEMNDFLSCVEMPICLLDLPPFEITNENSIVPVGYFAMVAAKSNFNSGLYVTSVLPNDLAQQLDDHLKY